MDTLKQAKAFAARFKVPSSICINNTTGKYSVHQMPYDSPDAAADGLTVVLKCSGIVTFKGKILPAEFEEVAAVWV